MARRRRRADGRPWAAIVGGTVLLVVALGAVGGALWHQSRSKDAGLDPRLCPSTGPTGHVVLLVDKTDPLNFTQKTAFNARLKDLVERQVPQGTLVSVFSLDQDFKKTAAPLVELCNPGTGQDRTEWDANLKKLRQRYERDFHAPLLQLADELVAMNAAKQSPIFEMLQLVGINAFQKDAVKGPRRLILVSDMLHNTPQYSMFKAPADFVTYAATDYGRKTLPNLSGVEVELHYIVSSPALQTKRNVKFWEDFFQQAGARVVKVNPLEG